MTTRFYIDVDLYEAAIEREGQRHGYASIELARAAVLADIEGRLVDAIRFRDGVARVGSGIVAAAGVD